MADQVYVGTDEPEAPRPAMRERLVRLPEDLDDAVKARAAHDDRTIAATVRVALRHWLACPHRFGVLPGAQHVPDEEI